MANDRFYIRCNACGDYMFLGKYYPGIGPSLTPGSETALAAFIQLHLANCQAKGMDFEGPICLVFDSEQTLSDAGGLIGGSGNIRVDRETKRETTPRPRDAKAASRSVGRSR